MAQSVLRDNIFAGKVALVSGGGTGIGRRIAAELLQLGAIVIIASRKLDVLQTTAKELNDTHTRFFPHSKNRCHAIACNIREAAEFLFRAVSILFSQSWLFLTGRRGSEFSKAHAGGLQTNRFSCEQRRRTVSVASGWDLEKRSVVCANYPSTSAHS